MQQIKGSDDGRISARYRRNYKDWRTVMIVVFVMSRIAIAITGVRFDDKPIFYAYQLLDASTLQHHLLDSVWHLHGQPPLFNLFIGAVMKVAPTHYKIVFKFAYLAISLGLTLCLFRIFTRLWVPPAIAAVVTLVFTTSPSVFLYENWLLYELPLNLMLCLAILALQRYTNHHRLSDAAVFLGSLAAMLLLRSLFHLLWFATWTAVLVLHHYHQRAEWRRVVVLAAVPLVVVCSVYVKNAYLFGVPTTSTWLGMSLAKVTTFQLDEDERRQLIARHELSPYAIIEPFSPLHVYRGLAPMPPPTGVAVLDDPVKGEVDPTTAGGYHTNYNNLAYIAISERYLTDVKWVLRWRPMAYLAGLRSSFQTFFLPSSDFFAVSDNRAHVASLAEFYNRVFGGVTLEGSGATTPPAVSRHYRPEQVRIAWFIVFAYVVAAVFGARSLWRAWRSRAEIGASPLVVAFLWGNLVYITVVCNLLEVGENNRFRLLTDPLVLALLGMLIAQALGRRRRV